ncbi:glycosyltransferase family 61 protein [Micrococcales bacterium 31B]|nr:glycosyltransferase family 61 protein [Micrococcales bacterium 31B]
MTIFDEALEALSSYIDHIEARPVVVLTDDGDLGSLSTQIASIGVVRICVVSLGAAGITQETRSAYPQVAFYEAWTVDRIQRVFESMEPAGAIVDMSGLEHARRQQVFENLVLNLADGGLYIVPDDVVDVPQPLASHVTQLFSGHKAAIYQVSGEFLIKLYDEFASGALTARMGTTWGEEILQLDSERVASNARVLSNNVSLESTYCPDSYEAPALHVRKYLGPSVYPGSLVTLDRFVLTDSFRHHISHRLSNAHLTSPTRFQAIAPEEPSEFLKGSFYLADNDRYGHFGHIMTEFVSKLWAWKFVKKIDSRVQFMISGEGEYRDLPAFVRQILEAFGLTERDVFVLNRPVKVGTLYGATPQFQNPRYVHHGINEVYTKLGTAIAGGQRKRTRRIFLDRVLDSGDNSRICHNADEVRAIFQSEGFEIVRPEELAFVDQVIMMNEATIVAGFAGSAFFSSVFTVGPINLIVIGSESYDATNEFMIASVKGGNVAHVWCTPDHPRERHWTMKAFTSDFTFDADRDTALIKQAIAEFAKAGADTSANEVDAP